MERNILDFIEHHVQVVDDVERAAAEARWHALLHDDEDSRKDLEAKEAALAGVYLEREHFARVRAYDEDSARLAPLLQRQLRVLRLRYAGYQLPAAAAARLEQTAESIERTARTWRVEVDGESLPLADARRTLDESMDAGARRRTWEAVMDLGDTVGPDLTRLVGVRNRLARDLDYDDYFEMATRFAELESADGFIDEVLAAAASAHRDFRTDIDAEIGEKLGAPRTKLVPWHFGGFWVEGVPGRKAPDLDRYLGDDPVATARELFAGIGIDIEPVLASGEVRAEATHGRRADIVLVNRDSGESRLRCVVGSDGNELDRLIELVVRAVCTRHLDPELPWVLREEPHPVTTGAIARVISRMARSPEFLSSREGANKSTITRMTNRDDEHARGESLLGMHVLCAVARFERALHVDPGQDLERLWWDNARTVLRVCEPEGRQGHIDWATRVELAARPLANLRELLVRLAAAQIEATLRNEFEGSPWGNPEVGALLVERGFAPGASLDWRGAIEHLTGKPLSPAAWVATIEPRT